jgi:hypothetical protein
VSFAPALICPPISQNQKFKQGTIFCNQTNVSGRADLDLHPIQATHNSAYHVNQENTKAPQGQRHARYVAP